MAEPQVPVADRGSRLIAGLTSQSEILTPSLWSVSVSARQSEAKGWRSSGRVQGRMETELDFKDCIGKIGKDCSGEESGQKNRLSCFCSPYRATEKVN